MSGPVKITLQFRALFYAMGLAGFVTCPAQADMQARVLYSEWVYG